MKLVQFILPEERKAPMRTRKALFGILTVMSALAVQARAQSSLTNGWVNLGAPIPGTGYTTCITDEVNGPQRFYRVDYLP